jgi:ribosomal-protein-alanine N-acetyltransferase
LTKLNIRPYIANDKEALVQLLVLNTPEFFDVKEKKDFEHYLDYKVEDYFVAEENGEILGAGGINHFPKERMARISWDLVKPTAQGKGVGRSLTKHRIELLLTNDKVDKISVRTTQLVFKFYEKMNFKLVKIEKDFWADGFDLYQMEMKADAQHF